MCRQDAILSHAVQITERIMSGAIKVMKQRKAGGSSRKVIEMILAASTKLMARIMLLRTSLFVIIQSQMIRSCLTSSTPKKARMGSGGLKWIEQVLKVVERFFEAILREKVNIDLILIMPDKSFTNFDNPRKTYKLKNEHIFMEMA